MASAIEWTGSTWNPIVGCSVVSPGCTNCYAMRMGARLGHMGQERYAGMTKPTKAGPVWTGEVRFVESALTLPLRTKTPTIWFVNSMSDLFHEGVPDEWIDRVFAIMALCAQHTFQVLTKRSARMRSYMTGDWAVRVYQAIAGMPEGAASAGWLAGGRPLPNVWLGVSAEDQRRADERVPRLLATPAAVRFVSAEPLLGPINFTELRPRDRYERNALDGYDFDSGEAGERLDWIIVGGESGPGARPMHPDWARQIRDDCAAAGVAFFFKQWGAWVPVLDRERDDPDWRADYRTKFADQGQTKWLNLAGGRGFHGERFHVMRRTSKAAAGRELDGRAHDAMPGRAA